MTTSSSDQAETTDLPRGLDTLSEALKPLDPPAIVTEHQAVFTVAESQALCAEIPGLHTKNLFLKDKKGALFLLTAPDDAEIDLKRLHTRLGAKGRMSFASAALLAEHLGVLPGSVTPLALINDTAGVVTGFLHPDVADAALVNVHPLRNTATVSLTGAQLALLLTEFGHPPHRLPAATPDP